MAGTIDNLTGATPQPGFGETGDAKYAGQTFKAGGDHMQSLDFFINPDGPGATKYHLLITTVNFAALAPGILPDTDTHITLANGKLLYDGIKFAKFTADVPANVDDIQFVVYA